MTTNTDLANIGKAKGIEIWQQTITHLHSEYGDAIFKSWFSNLQFQEVMGDVLVITAPTKFIREWVLTNYFSKIYNFVRNLDSGIKRIDLRVREISTEATNDSKPSENSASSIKKRQLNSKLDKKFTFENFIIGPSNKLAYTVMQNVIAKSTNLPSNIIYVYGHVGLGKTHLLQAIAHQLNAEAKSLKVSYLSAEKFMHLYILAVRNNELLYFKERMRELDVLLIDDIQFLCGKNATQREFSNTLGALVEDGKTIIISADKSPYNLDLDVRSKSRLTSGIVVDIKPADYNLRLEVLKHYSAKLDFTIDNKILEFIATNVSSSIREVEAALQKLVTHRNLTGGELNLELTQTLLQDCLNANNRAVTLDKIIEVICNYYNIDIDSLLSKSRAVKYVFPRQLAALIAKELTTISLQEIGKGLGNRDHSTIIYYIKKAKEKISKDEMLKSVINDIRQAITQA